MSTPHRAAARRRARQKHRPEWFAPDAVVCTVAGWCKTEAELAETKGGTHDAVIRLTGSNRTGGVKWIIRQGEDAERVLSELKDGNPPEEIFNHYRRISTLLREHGGYLVVACVEAVAPPGTVVSE